MFNKYFFSLLVTAIHVAQKLIFLTNFCVENLYIFIMELRFVELAAPVYQKLKGIKLRNQTNFPLYLVFV